MNTPGAASTQRCWGSQPSRKPLGVRHTTTSSLGAEIAGMRSTTVAWPMLMVSPSQAESRVSPSHQTTVAQSGHAAALSLENENPDLGSGSMVS